MWFRRRPVLPTVSGYRTRETSKVRPSLPLGAASSRRAESPTPQPSRPVFFSHLPVGRGRAPESTPERPNLTTDLTLLAKRLVMNVAYRPGCISGHDFPCCRLGADEERNT